MKPVTEFLLDPGPRGPGGAEGINWQIRNQILFRMMGLVFKKLQIEIHVDYHVISGKIHVIIIKV